MKLKEAEEKAIKHSAGHRPLTGW